MRRERDAAAARKKEEDAAAAKAQEARALKTKLAEKARKAELATQVCCGCTARAEGGRGALHACSHLR
jgi:hypothetical protein